MFDLLDLGLSLCRWLTGKVAYQGIDYVEHSNPSSFMEHLRGWLQKDIDRIGTKLDSQSHSKISAALSYMRRALALMHQDITAINKFKVFPKSYGLLGVHNYLREADKWATEAFYDKNNVSAKWRLESVNVQLFCSLILHNNHVEKVLILWREIFEEVIRDKELVHSILSKSWLFAPNPEVKSLALELIRNLRGALISLNCRDQSLICELWNVLLHPKLESSEDEPEWYRVCFSGLNSYRLIGGNYMLITYPFHQFCVLPENRVCATVPDGENIISMQIYDNSCLSVEQNLSVDDPLTCCTVAYDPKRDALLLVQRKSIRMFDKQFNSLGSFDNDTVINGNKHMMCSVNGVWVSCDETNLKIHIRWYSTSAGDWINVPFDLPGSVSECKYFMTLMDIRDDSDNSVQIIIRITENLLPRFFLIFCSLVSTTQKELTIENLNLLRLDDQASVWMLFKSSDSKEFFVIWADGENTVNLLKVSEDGKTLEEHFVSLPVPFGLRHIVIKLPYIFCGVLPYACSSEDYKSYVKQIKS